MPVFDLIPMQEAVVRCALTGKRGEIMEEYFGYVSQLKPGKAGKLSLVEGDTSAAVKQRLGTAAKLKGKQLVVKRVDDDIYFWEAETQKRRGRPRKS
ncbi:MAG TPA: hypothetical protein EYN72_11065 [Dehalococcoidia bacterium]|nr:hypothetical protein [Dehalococcoidia bacterium]